MTRTLKNVFGVIVLTAACFSLAAVSLACFAGLAVMMGGV